MRPPDPENSVLCIRVSAHFNFALMNHSKPLWMCVCVRDYVNTGIWQAKDRRLVRHGISIKINSRIHTYMFVPYIASLRGLTRVQWDPSLASCGFFTQLHSGARLACDALWRWRRGKAPSPSAGERLERHKIVALKSETATTAPTATTSCWQVGEEAEVATNYKNQL